MGNHQRHLYQAATLFKHIQTKVLQGLIKEIIFSELITKHIHFTHNEHNHGTKLFSEMKHE